MGHGGGRDVWMAVPSPSVLVPLPGPGGGTRGHRGLETLREHCCLPCKECADPENHKVRQKLKAKEWDEFLAKGKRFRVLQPVKIGCIWAADKDGGADRKVLQQFTACLLETVPSEEEQTPKASRREKRDQQSECQRLPGTGGDRAPSAPGPGRLLGGWTAMQEGCRPITKAAPAERISCFLDTTAGPGPLISALPRGPGSRSHMAEAAASSLFGAGGAP